MNCKKKIVATTANMLTVNATLRLPMSIFCCVAYLHHKNNNENDHFINLTDNSNNTQTSAERL